MEEKPQIEPVVSAFDSQVMAEGPQTTGTKRKMLPVFLTGMATGLIVVLFTLAPLLFNLGSSSDYGDLGAALFYEFVLDTLSLIGAFLLGVFLLKKWGVEKPKLLQGLLVICSIPFNFALLSLTLLLPMIVLALYPLSYGLLAVTIYLFLRALAKISYVFRVITISSVVVVFAVFCYTAMIAADIANSFIKVQASGIQIYKPSYTPSGYYLDYASLSEEDNTYYAQYKLQYLSTRSGYDNSYKVTSYEYNGAYSPPQDCGDEFVRKAPYREKPCKELGKTQSNNTVYFNYEPSSNEFIASQHIGNTVVLLIAEDNDNVVKKQEVLNIFSSLERKNIFQSFNEIANL